jgi:hypothetical protein
MLTHPKNGTKFIDERCDVFMNEREIRTKEKNEDRSLKKFQVFTLKMMIQCN